MYLLRPISIEAKDWVTMLSEDYERTSDGSILIHPSDMPDIGKTIKEDYLDITKDFRLSGV